MFRNRVRPPLPPLDEATAEHLLARSPVENLPLAYRVVEELLSTATVPATPDELNGGTAAAASFVAAHEAANAPVRPARMLVVAAVTTLLIAASTGTAVAATNGVLPEPVQQAAHDALGVVGISVPGIETTDPGPEGHAGVDAPSSGAGQSDASTGNHTPNGVTVTPPAPGGTTSAGTSGVATPAAGDTTGDPTSADGNSPAGDNNENGTSGDKPDPKRDGPGPGDGPKEDPPPKPEPHAPR